MDKYRVPAKLMKSLLGPFLENMQTDMGYIYESPNLQHSALEAFAFRAGVPDRRLRAIMNDEQENIDFGTADKIVSAMGNPIHYWTETPLKDYYLPFNPNEDEWEVPYRDRYRPEKKKPQRQNLPPVVEKGGLKQCAWSGCDTMFRPRTAGRPQIYCSRQHARYGQAERSGTVRTKQGQETHKRLVNAECPKGHPRNEENTYWQKRGGKLYAQCRPCKAESQRGYAERQRLRTHASLGSRA